MNVHKHDERVQLSEHKQGLQTPSKPRKAGENGDIVQDQEMACSVDIRILTPKISIDQGTKTIFKCVCIFWDFPKLTLLILSLL